MSVSNIGSSFKLALGNYAKFIPNTSSSSKSLISSAIDVAKKVISGGSQLGGMVSIDPAYRQLIEQQIELQQQMMLVSMHSNLERSKHDTKMSAVRNIRVS